MNFATTAAQKRHLKNTHPEEVDKRRALKAALREAALLVDEMRNDARGLAPDTEARADDFLDRMGMEFDIDARDPLRHQ